MSALPFVSDTFDPTRWRQVEGFDFSDITYHRGISRGPEADGRPEGADMPVVRIAFDRPDIRNAFRPGTVDELYRALDHARQTSSVAAVILTGNGPSARDAGTRSAPARQRSEAVTGTATRSRGRTRRRPPRSGASRSTRRAPGACTSWRSSDSSARCPRSSSRPFPAGLRAAATPSTSWRTCRWPPSSTRRSCRRTRTWGLFDAGYGSALLARQAGDKRAREIFFLAERYDAETAERWGVINRAAPTPSSRRPPWTWAATIATKSPQAIRMLKFAFNLADDGLAGQQVFAGEATRMAYMTAEAQEGRDAFLEHRPPRWEDYPYYY